ncbi:LOW QUALITY PROTEIN: eukaryotic translation initiation factor 4 gamma 3 [Bombina bombina]|uniref:LOW QUALITY PROTEIN: eukaryotic translation initiation factor 4 gamma 3 n=1 Tax=Bombina bombina TaxID=8345 RepID=UPI00235AC574|nr:LOW QUALITY PROTEIN: eukaryotic translation initiation factor 4 gamma 3 [Bombina bombina]
MSLPHKPALKPAAVPPGAGSGAVLVGPPPSPSGAPSPAAAPHPGIRATMLSWNGSKELSFKNGYQKRISRGALTQSLDERIFPPSAVSVYSTVAAQVARQPGPPAPSPYSTHDLNKGHPNLAATPPGHASSPGLSQCYNAPPGYFIIPPSVQNVLASYASGQNASAPTLVYPQPPQTMSTQPQNRSPFAAGPRPTHHQGGFRPIQFFQRPQIQPPRATIQNSSPSIRPGAQTPTAVYQTNQHIMMVNHLPMSYAMPQGPQYCIPQYRHSTSPYVGPPQQYPVQPPGPNPFYPGPGPGEFPPTYGTPFYTSQPVYQSAPIIVPTQQQQQQPPPLPTKREKKTIRIRDPNQGGKDITEEIMSGGGSRNPTPPILRPNSTPTPPHLPSQAPEHSPVVYGTVETTHLTASIPVPAASELKQEEKPKQDSVLKSTPPTLQLEPMDTEKIDILGLVSESASSDIRPELHPASCLLPVVPAAPVVVATTPAFPCDLEGTGQRDSTVEECTPPPITEFLEDTATEETEDELCKDPLGLPVPAVTPVTASALPAQEINGISEVINAVDSVLGEKTVLRDSLSSEVSESAPASPTESNIECTSPSNVPLSSPALSVSPQPDSPPPPHIAATLCTTKTSPPATTLPTAGQEEVEEQEDAMIDGAGDIQSSGKFETDIELDSGVKLLSFTSRKSLAEAQTVVTSPKMWKKVPDGSSDIDETFQLDAEPQEDNSILEEKAGELEQDQMSYSSGPTETEPPYTNAKSPEENGEAEPVRNGADVSEVDGADFPSGPEKGLSHTHKSGSTPVEQPSEAPQDPPRDHSEEPGGKKQYDRDFLLSFQYMPACVQKPDGLPPISDVVLDKINQPKLPIRTLDTRMLQRGPDFTPAYADFGRPSPGGRGVPLLNVGPRRSQPGQRRGEPRKIIMNISVTDDVHLKKSENAWKPGVKREGQPDDPDNVRTQALFRKVRSILNKLTPQMFNQLMKQVTDLTVDTEERLKGVIDLVFEKAIDEPSFSVAYANMCRCLATLKVPMADKPGSTVNFRKLLLTVVQKEFEKDKADDDVFEKKQKDLELAKTPEEKTAVAGRVGRSQGQARRRSIGNIKFIGELFKLKMLTEAIMHDCVVKLLKNHDEESLECLCRLLTTIGKDLDFEKAKPRMDQYFNQMEKIVKERKTSSRIRFMLQDIIDLRLCNWVSRRADQGPKTIEQIHKEAKIEEQEEQRKVQQLMTKDKRRPGVQRVEEGGWNMVQGAKNNRVLDPTKFLKITKPTIDEKIQLVPKAQPGSWGKGSSGGAKASETESLRPGASSLNRFSPLQQSAAPVPSSTAVSELDPRRTLTSHGSTGREKNDKPTAPSTGPPAVRPGSFLRGSSGKELIDNQEELRRETLQTVKHLMANTEMEKNTGLERKVKEPAKSETPELEKSSLSEEEMERKSKAVIDEFLHINDYKEAMQCVEELGSHGLLSVFVRVGVESTLERSQITRDHMGQLLYQLVQSGKLSKLDFFKGFSETLDLADDMAIDIPHIWLYLAELVTPMLKEGGISLRELITEFNKALLPVGRGGDLLCEILHLLCKQMSHKKVAALWRETGLKWKDLLPEGEDVQSFVSEKQNLDFTLSDSSSPSDSVSKKEMSAEELNKRLEELIIEEKANDEQIFDWVEANLDEFHMSSPTFLRALMTAVCKAAIIGDCSSCRVDTTFLKQRVPVLFKYLDSDTERELQALYALQALIVKLDQPPNLLRMFFDCLYDEEVISEDAFYKWENSKDPAEQNGKGVALKSVTAFFTWLREAEEESEDN